MDLENPWILNGVCGILGWRLWDFGWISRGFLWTFLDLKSIIPAPDDLQRALNLLQRPLETSDRWELLRNCGDQRSLELTARWECLIGRWCSPGAEVKESMKISWVVLDFILCKFLLKSNEIQQNPPDFEIHGLLNTCRF